MSQKNEGQELKYEKRKPSKRLQFDNEGHYIFSPSPLVNNFGLHCDLNLNGDLKIDYCLRYCIKAAVHK